MLIPNQRQLGINGAIDLYPERIRLPSISTLWINPPRDLVRHLPIKRPSQSNRYADSAHFIHRVLRARHAFSSSIVGHPPQAKC